MGPRTVLFVHSSAGRYGADRQLALLAGGLDPARYRALVLLPHAGPLAGDLRVVGVEVVQAPVAVLRRALLSPTGLGGVLGRAGADAVTLARLARARGVALMHSNTSVVLGGAAAAARAGLPHVWHVREIYSDFARLWPAHRRLLLRGAAALPCVSHAAREQFGTGRRAAARTLVLPDGVAVADAGANGERARARARARLGLEPQVFVCSVLGRLSDWKGQDVFVRALAHPAAPPGAIGLVAGDPWPGRESLAAELSGLARSLGVAERIRLLGFAADPGDLYAASDVVVVPSTLPDPLPNSALEAAAAGRCVVASALGGLPEIVEDGRTGRLVAPGDPAALATVLSELERDEDARARLGAAAALDARTRFSPERLLGAVQDLYDRLLSR